MALSGGKALLLRLRPQRFVLFYMPSAFAGVNRASGVNLWATIP